MEKEIQKKLTKTIVISDMHFGDRSQLLNKSSLVDRLMEVLADRGAVEELILLGDVFDLWASTTIPSFREGRHFIFSISQLDNIKKVLYIPGNHDHLVFMNAFRSELDQNILRGDLTSPKFMPARSYESTVIRGLAHPDSNVPFSMVYPFVVRKVRDREVLYTHGHHLDFYDTSYGWARTFWLSRRVIKKRRKKASLHDIEMANLPFCGAMSVVPWVPELVEGSLRFYRIINFFSKLLRKPGMQKSPRRDTLIKENYDEISGLLPLLGHPAPGCFIFGHTHRPGMGKIPGTQITIANTGSWVRAEDNGAPNMTWVEVEHDVKLYRLLDDKVELMYSDSI